MVTGFGVCAWFHFWYCNRKKKAGTVVKRVLEVYEEVSVAFECCVLS